jgi:ABC-type glycerol-3-phosphate transport system substrate-binding protein
MLLVLSIVLILSACSGGNSGNGGNNSAPTNNGAGAETATPAPVKEVVEEVPAVDLNMNGRTIKFLAWWDATPTDATPEGQQMLANIAELEKKHNIKIVFEAVAYDDVRTIFTDSTLAGEPAADFFRMQRSWFAPGMIDQEMILPISDYIELYNVEGAFGDDSQINIGSYGGKSYGIAGDVGGFGLYFNRGLLADLNLENPHELFANGQWSWSKMLEMMRAATQDTNNDGTPDTWGLAAKDEDLLGVLVATNGSNLVDLAARQEKLSDPKTIEALEFYKQLYDEKLIRLNEAWSDYINYYGEGNTLFFPGHNWESGRVKEQLVDKDFGYVPFPRGPQATADHSYNSQVNMWTMPSNVKQPEELLYIFREIYDVTKVEEWPGQTDLEPNFNHDEDLESARYNRENVVVFDHGSVPGFPIQQILDDLRMNNVPVGTVVESLKGTIQAAIDGMFTN